MTDPGLLWVIIGILLFALTIVSIEEAVRFRNRFNAYEARDKANQDKLEEIWRKEPYAYVKKPTKIQAIKIEDIDSEDGIAIRSRVYDGPQTPPDWFVKAFNNGDIQAGRKDGGNVLYVKTLEGEHVIRPGMWLIRGIKGELYGCQDDIFNELHE